MKMKGEEVRNESEVRQIGNDAGIVWQYHIMTKTRYGRWIKSVSSVEGGAQDHYSDGAQDLWGYGGVGRVEKDHRQLMGVTLNPAVMTERRYQKPGREWRELDRGGFINLPIWLRNYEDEVERSSVEFRRLVKLYGIEDDDGYETDEEWRVKAVDRILFEDIFVHGVKIEDIDFTVGCDMMKDARDERRMRRAKMNKIDGENTVDAMDRIYPEPEYTDQEAQFTYPRFSKAYRQRLRRDGSI